ncbi:hypothetical protein TNCV_2368741 [Trichonephila clavipes]|nr:hypothetical protein TNCV_2368741 [Trichonephila clavipes]
MIIPELQFPELATPVQIPAISQQMAHQPPVQIPVTPDLTTPVYQQPVQIQLPDPPVQIHLPQIHLCKSFFQIHQSLNHLSFYHIHRWSRHCNLTLRTTLQWIRSWRRYLETTRNR